MDTGQKPSPHSNQPLTSFLSSPCSHTQHPPLIIHLRTTPLPPGDLSLWRRKCIKSTSLSKNRSVKKKYTDKTPSTPGTSETTDYCVRSPYVIHYRLALSWRSPLVCSCSSGNWGWTTPRWTLNIVRQRHKNPSSRQERSPHLRCPSRPFVSFWLPSRQNIFTDKIPSFCDPTSLFPSIYPSVQEFSEHLIRYPTHHIVTILPTGLPGRDLRDPPIPNYHCYNRYYSGSGDGRGNE